MAVGGWVQVGGKQSIIGNPSSIVLGAAAVAAAAESFDDNVDCYIELTEDCQLHLAI